MALTGRPRLPLEEKSNVIRVVLSLHPEHDKDLIDWFESLPPRQRSRAVIARLRTGNAPAELFGLPADEEVIAALDGFILNGE